MQSNRRSMIGMIITALAFPFASITRKSVAQEQKPEGVTDANSLVRGLKLRPDIATLSSKGDQELAQGTLDSVKDKPYLIVLINKSSYAVVAFKAGAAAWFNVNPIGRTCDLRTCKDCYDAGKGVTLTAVTCNGPSFQLYVMVRDLGGKLFQVGPATIRPDCNFNGEAVCLDI